MMNRKNVYTQITSKNKLMALRQVAKQCIKRETRVLSKVS